MVGWKNKWKQTFILSNHQTESLMNLRFMYMIKYHTSLMCLNKCVYLKTTKSGLEKTLDLDRQPDASYAI